MSGDRFQVVLDEKPSREYPLSYSFPQGSIFISLYFAVMIFLDDVICYIGLSVDDTTFYSKCDQVSYMWQEPELVSELESESLWTGDWGRK